MTRAAAFILSLALFAGALPAQAESWRDLAAPNDVERVEKRDEAWSKALSEAQAGGAAQDMAVLHQAMSGGGAAINTQAILGNWSCRTIKVGGLTALTVYGKFRCRFIMRNGQLFFEKLNGSQRVSGNVYEDGGMQMILLGALSVANEPQGIYAGTGAIAGGEVAQSNQIGILVKASANRMRLEFPYPYYESTFDVLELTR